MTSTTTALPAYEQVTPPRGAFSRLPVFWKLLLPFATLMLIVGAVAAYLVVRNDRALAQTTLTQNLQEGSLRTRGQLQAVELGLLEAANLAANLAGMAEAVRDADQPAAADLLRSVIALRPELAGVTVHDPTGATLAALAPAGSEAPELTDTAPVQDALADVTGNRRSGIAFARDGRSTIVVAAPICSGVTPCEPVGVAVVSRDLDDVIAAVEDAVAETSSVGIGLFDRDGTLLAAEGETPRALPADVDATNQLVRLTGQVDDAEAQTLYAPLQLQGEPHGTVAVSLPTAPAFDAVRTNGRTLALVLAVALLGIVGVGGLVTRAILRQVYPLVEVNRRLGSGDLSARVPVVTDDEIGDVARGLNVMAERLEASYDTLESRVEQRTAEVQRLLRQRTEFFASLSHELRTPLAIVLGQAELLLLDDDDETQQTGRAIQQSAGQLLGVVSEILELARAESGTLEVDVQPTDLDEFLAGMRPTLGGLAQVGELDVDVAVAPDLAPALADPGRLREIMLNLVDNAVKYSPKGSTVTVMARAGQDADGSDRVVLTVADQGRGIPDDVGDALFEPFARVGDAPRTGQSTGLGLALTKQLVVAQGGTITYQSELGVGTTFTVTLQPADAHAAATVPSPVPSGGTSDHA